MKRAIPAPMAVASGLTELGRRQKPRDNETKPGTGMSERDLHFNDLRGTAATKFYIARFTMREIAETLA